MKTLALLLALSVIPLKAAVPADVGLGGQRAMAFIACRDSKTARSFYQQKVGLKLLSEEPMALVFDGNGTMIRMQIVKDAHPLPYTALGWQVKDIGLKVRELTGIGIKFEKVEGVPQDDLGIWTAPDKTQVAWFKDPDGNILSVSQF